MTKALIAIDPGVHCTGWATFDERGCLTGAGVVEAKNIPEAVESARGMATLYGIQGRPLIRIVIECPMIYPNVRAKGDPNDALGVAVVAGAYGAALCAYGAITYRRPHEYKGQTPKDVMHRRAVEAMNLREIRTYHECVSVLPKTKREDAADAVALGMVELGRIER